MTHSAKRKTTYLPFMYLTLGRASSGHHTCPACQKVPFDIQLNKKTWFWPKYSVFFIDFRSRCPVTSGDVIPHPSNGNNFWGICICSRFYSTPCFFGYIATHAQGLRRSLRFTRAQTISVNSTAQGLLSKQANRLLLSDWSKWVTWTNWWRIPCLWGS